MIEVSLVKVLKLLLPVHLLPHGSLNENLNMPVPQRGSRHQSISEKLIITTIILQFKQVLLYLLVLI